MGSRSSDAPRELQGRRSDPREHPHVPPRRRLGAAPEDKPWYNADRPARVLPARARVPRGRGDRSRCCASRWTPPSTSPNSILSNRTHPSIVPEGARRHYGSPGSTSATSRPGSTGTSSDSGPSSEDAAPAAEADDAFRFIFQTPKYRWGAHSTAVDSDWIAMLFGPFGDPYRRDGRPRGPARPTSRSTLRTQPRSGSPTATTPGSTPTPTIGRTAAGRRTTPYYEVARVMMRVRFYTGMPRGVIRTWFNMYAATPSTVAAQKQAEGHAGSTRRRGYVSLFRHGSHQSGTRAWLRPTQMTESLVRKAYFGQVIGTGFEADVSLVSGAPKEAFVRIEQGRGRRHRRRAAVASAHARPAPGEPVRGADPLSAGRLRHEGGLAADGEGRELAARTRDGLPARGRPPETAVLA